MKRVDDFRLRLGKPALVPIMVGGMGVCISRDHPPLEAAPLGGVGDVLFLFSTSRPPDADLIMLSGFLL